AGAGVAGQVVRSSSGPQNRGSPTRSATNMTDSTASRRPACSCRRRSLLKLMAVGLGLPRIATAEGEESAPPRENDRLVVALGARAGEPIAPEDLDVGAKQLFAYPQDPSTALIRSGSRLDQV